MRPKIVYEFEGRRVIYPLDKDVVTIGRSPDNDIVLNRQYISRMHARLYNDSGIWRVEDLGSKCGTVVNDLGHANKALAHGDRIVLQDFALAFVERLSPGGVADPGVAPSAAAVSLIAPADSAAPLGIQTTFQSAVDFSELASASPDVSRLQTLLGLVTESSEIILASTSLDETFTKVLDLVFERMPVQRGFIMLRSSEGGDLETRCVKQTGGGGSSGEIQFSRTIAEKVIREKVAVVTTDAQTDGRFAEGASIIALGIRSAMAAPIWNGDRVEGLIYTDTLQQARAFDKFDLDLLSALGHHVAIAIEQSRLQSSVVEQQVVRRRLERYHSPAVVDRIADLSKSDGDALVADEREVTVVFADVVGFTRRCERIEPRAVAELLNRYFSVMSEAIFQHEGTLDKFIGDCLMAVFGAPLSTDDHARRAALAALDMRDALAELNESQPEASRLEFRVGIHSGHVIAGDIGSVRRSDYTVLGATVNQAARLESMVARPGQIVVSDATWQAMGPGFSGRELGRHDLKGITDLVLCHELLGRPADAEKTKA
jgi:adenylate cyclase